VLGARILKDLLQLTSARVVCLVRGTSLARCQERLRSFVRLYYTDGELEPDFAARVIVLQGDVSVHRFGLSQHTYDELQVRTDITIHAAANTSLLASYQRLAPTNVTGTGHVIDFCLGTASKTLSYVSTYTVMGTKTFDSGVRFRETDYEMGQGFEYMGYQRSKFVAEGLVRSARERGLKWRIFRPGQIYGDSATGAYPHAETKVAGLFYDLFRTAMDTRVMPESYIHYDVVPVDYVSRAIVSLSALDNSLYEVYHLINPDTKTFSQVMALLCQAGYVIELLPEEIYKRKLGSGEITRQGHPYTSAMLKAFSHWYFVSKISFYNSAMTDCEFTRLKLEGLGVSCPPTDRTLIETYVRAGVREGYFPKPARIDGESTRHSADNASAGVHGTPATSRTLVS
jgi:thioester reductase-like protein